MRSAIILGLLIALVVIMVRPARADELEDLAIAAQVNVEDLRGASITTGLDPHTYLVAVGHLDLPRRGFTAADTHAAIAAAARTHGVSHASLQRTVRCETGGTFDPYIRGDYRRVLGRYTSHGAAQINDLPTGLLADFLALGYDDPTNPYQALDFMGRAFKGELRGRAIGPQRWMCF